MTHRRKSPLSLVWLLLIAPSAALSFIPVFAQQSAAPGAPAAAISGYTFRKTVRRVVLDVVVTDDHSKPIQGLRPENFSVVEDGQAQRVLSFDLHRFDGAMDYTPPTFPSQPTNTFVNLPSTPERGPLYIILYDLVNIPPDDQGFARRQLIHFIQEKPAGARFAIFVCSDGLHLLQGFTSDERALMAVVNLQHPVQHMPISFLMGVNFSQGDKLATAGRLNFIADYLKGLPGRKNLIWMASKFPLSLFPNEYDTNLYRSTVRRTLARLASDQISVYPVDTSGVISVESYGAPQDTGSVGGLTSDVRDNGLSLPIGGGGPSPAAAAAAEAIAPASKIAGGAGYTQTGSSYMVQDEIANVTGGKAFYSSNDLKMSLQKATEDGGTYYTLTYSPPRPDQDDQIRRIKVDLDRKGCHLSYRQAYYISDREEAGEAGRRPLERGMLSTGASPTRQDERLVASMNHGAPAMHQLIFGAHVRPMGEAAMGTPEQMTRISDQPAFLHEGRPNGKPLKPIRLQTYQIDYTVMAHQLQIAGATAPNLEIAAAIYDADGRTLNSSVNAATQDNPDPAKAGAPRKAYRLQQQLDAPMNAKFIRLAVRDANTDRIGAMEIALPLPPEPEMASAP